MQNETALEYLLKKIEEQRNVVVHHVISGNVPEHEYRRLTGVIQGLDFSTNAIKDLANRLEGDADNE